MARKSSAEINDQAWNGLIQIALKAQRRIGKFHNKRFDRMQVYTVKNIRELAGILVEAGAIKPWPGGFRRLGTIEQAVIADFLKIHKERHTNP